MSPHLRPFQFINCCHCFRQTLLTFLLKLHYTQPPFLTTTIKWNQSACTWTPSTPLGVAFWLLADPNCICSCHCGHQCTLSICHGDMSHSLSQCHTVSCTAHHSLHCSPLLQCFAQNQTSRFISTRHLKFCLHRVVQQKWELAQAETQPTTQYPYFYLSFLCLYPYF